MLYVADTHSLIWFLSEDSKLSQKAKDLFEKAEYGEEIIIIPTIVLAELPYICEEKSFRESFSKIIEKIKIGTNYIPYELDVSIILECKNLDKISEIHDKIITATALLLNASVITKDENIWESDYVETIW